MINYLENEKIKDLFITKSNRIQKTELTLGSTKPDNHSVIVNGELITFVKDNKGNLLEETRSQIHIPKGMCLKQNK